MTAHADPLLAPHLHAVDLPLTGDWLGLAGDWHGNDAWAACVLGHLAGRDIRTVIQLGDFGIWHGEGGQLYLDRVQAAAERHDQQVWIVDGNHEDFDLLERHDPDDRGIRMLRPRIGHLPRGLRWTWHGVRFLALGGATSLDAADRTLGRSWWAQEALTAEQHAHAVAGGQADIMLTHDAPAGARVPGLGTGWRPAALEHAVTHRWALRQSVDAIGPVRLFHGHFHVAYQDTLDLSTGPLLVTGLSDDSAGRLNGNAGVLDLDQLAEDVTRRRATPTDREYPGDPATALGSDGP